MTSGTWSVEVRLAADLPAGRYRVKAGCYTDSGLNSGFGPVYALGRLEVRLQEHGPPSASTRRGRPGDSVQVTSGQALCAPPAGSSSPRVRVSLLDASSSTRAEAEGSVEAVSGRWSVTLKVPEVPAQNGSITAVCLARVGAPSPYARYQASPFVIEAQPQPPTPRTSLPLPPSATSVPAVPGGPTTVPPSPPAVLPGDLPPTPLAVPIVAEPTYTG